MPARWAASRQAAHSILSVIGLSAREPFTVPGVGGGEKGYQFGGEEGATYVLAQWTPTTLP